LIADGLDYKGFIFLGLINVNGDPMVIEYNARMGDPETQAVLPRISSDLVDLLVGCADGAIDQVALSISPHTACTVVMVAGGYPGNYQKGLAIKGLDIPSENYVFHAGTASLDGAILTNGGRVLAITALGNDLESSLNSAYHTVNRIEWPDVYYRKDIGQDLIVMANKTMETSAE